MQKKIIVSFVSILLTFLILIIIFIYINSVNSNTVSRNHKEQEIQNEKNNNDEKNKEEKEQNKEETGITKENEKNDTSLNNNVSTQEDHIDNNISTRTEKNVTDTNNTNLEDSYASESSTSNTSPTNSNNTAENNMQYIGIPNPNDFYYSFHKGHIDDAYTTLEECYNKAFEVGFLDTVDIINETCYEVLDGQGTVLGIYMSVNCNSGNCERYKKMVGINTN